MLIGEVARISGLSKDGIRHYEGLGLVSSRPRQAGSRVYREYDASAVDTIDKVRQAQRLGFSLQEIGPLLKAHARQALSLRQTIVFLEARLAVVRDKIHDLREVEDFIERKLQGYRQKKSRA